MEEHDPLHFDCTGDWGDAMSGMTRRNQLYPEYHSTYWYYRFKRKPGDTFGLEFKGLYGHARFQSFTVYNDRGDDAETGGGTIIKSLADVYIDPDEGSQNPYQSGADRTVPDDQRRYTLVVVPEGSSHTRGVSDKNLITFDPSFSGISVWLRMYLPDASVADTPDGPSGGVPLPTIRAFDTETGRPVRCPRVPVKENPPVNPAENLPPESSDGRALFYRTPFGNLYPNKFNVYLSSLFTALDETVAVVSLRPPTFPDTYRDCPRMPPLTEVRYWSFNVGGSQNTNATDCLADYQARVSEDGWMRIVLSRGHPEVRAKAAAMGYNFLSWGTHHEAVLIYRNLLGQQTGHEAGLVPVYDPNHSGEPQTAEYWMGDYGPRGVIYSVGEFLNHYRP